MSDNREETSVQRTSSEPAGLALAAVDKALPMVGVERYVPNVFDLVFPTHRARDTVKLYIPPVFLQSEAVDSSLLLGHGASFVVTRQALPPGPAEVKERTDMGGWVVEKVVKAPEQPRYVVYKSANVRFQPNGDPATPEDRRALQSVLTEFHVLLHPPLLHHQNIIDFLGLAWGSNHAEPLHQLPVLVVEYGDRGTLADVQRLGPPLPTALKKDVCLGIARGLDALHRHGIIHGDVKPDNIIMCSHKEKIIVPKLADFGFAIIETTELPTREVMIGGTRTWRAPESFWPIPTPKLMLTDVYSFGLVAWSVAIDGQDPFNLVLPDSLQGEQRLKEIDRLKAADEILVLSKLEKWCLYWRLQNRLKEHLAQPQTESSQNITDTQQANSLLTRLKQLSLSQRPDGELLQGISPVLQQYVGVATSKLYEDFRAQELFKDLDLLFSHTLSKDPDNRDLSAVIRLLESNEDDEIDSVAILNLEASQKPAPVIENKDNPIRSKSTSSDPKINHIYHITNKSSNTKYFRRSPIRLPEPALPHSGNMDTGNSSQNIDWHRLGFKAHRYSWQMTRDLEPRVQNFVVKSLFQLDDASRQFSLTAFLLNGYGVPSDDERGLHFLIEAAHVGHSIAQAYLYRMFAACSKEVPSQVPVLQYLKDKALRGSRMALVDLKKLDPIQAVQIRELLKFGYAGVGADWYYDNQWLHGLTQSELMNKDFSPERLGSKTELTDVIANKRGDRLIHAAAAIGAFGLLQELVTDFKFDVNQQNAKGETALLCACRSGHPEIVKFLLDSGARASLQSTDGESPLHWLISFDEKINVAALGKDLIERGSAKVDAFTMRRISHSMFPGSIDVDFQVEGTPLMWAVHNNQPRIVSFLLSMGANPNWRLVKGAISPIEWASFFHHTECLKLLIEHLEKTADVPTTTDGKRDIRHAVVYGPLVAKAIHASDKFSMIVRNGVNYLTQLRSTLALLQEKTKLVRFNLGQNQTPIHYACRGAYDEACKIILELDWLTRGINTPAGLGERTPLLESVRWNRRSLFHLLRSHGAEVHALCPSPFDKSGQRTWSALHILADQAHNDDVSIVDDLIAAGVPVDGDPATETETPFHIAVRRNAFCLADVLRSHCANPDALRRRSALLVAPHPLTTLGHAIARNSRHGLPALRYLLALQPRPAFIVEPSRRLTALHLAALVPDGFAYVGGGELARVDFDWETNGAIVHELLTCFCDRDEMDARCLQGKTALHFAAEGGNSGVVEELVRAGADVNLRCEMEETAADVARRFWGQEDGLEVLRKLLSWLEK